MNKKILTKLLIILLFLIILASFVVTSNVKAESITLNEKHKITNDMEIDVNSLGEEKIMEYDAVTGITREVDMETLKEAIGQVDKTEAYNPLSNVSFSEVDSTRLVTFNPVPNLTSFPYRATCRLKADVYGEMLYGSGSVVGPNIILTAAHCVMNMNDNDNFFSNWVAYPGYSSGNSYMGVSSSDIHNEYFSSSARSVGGFSGGPFMRTSDNCIVGICHGTWTDDPNTSIGVRITEDMVNIINANS